MDLPKGFTNKMSHLLQDEFVDFIHSYSEPKQQGLRVNTLKVSLEEWEKLNPFHLENISWVKTGFFYTDVERPGKHPYHDAGLYYLQEPSAMAVGEIIAPMPGERVLDLCAAPGGKTTHIASQMNQEGLLVTNEIHPARAKILSQNVERMGIKNAVVTNETPAKLAQRFPNFFDRIMVDAPCSGEGMFRKDPDACAEWSLDNVAVCASRQLDILTHAATMLRPGGRLVYSTCTFSPEENEAVISEFLHQNPTFEMDTDVNVYEHFSQGRSDWIANPTPQIHQTIRLWPHKIQGEGHFIAVLRKLDGDEPIKRNVSENTLSQKQLKDFHTFAKETLKNIPDGQYLLFGEQLYIIPNEMLSFKNLKVLRPGWHLGTMKKNRFEPSHSLALSLKADEVAHVCNFSSDSPELQAYLHGESLQVTGEKGWHLVTVDGFSLGWGKLTDQTLKNHYPKGLRRLN
ncbi:MAG TPA: NOL1/NOP2/sun family putative RNA methylase [Bacilli bacterium]|nr:NOL1/NOP2/sun family putative RNA methylase [Bacilli bacterium]